MKLKLPKFKLPKLNIPDINMPKLSIPKLQFKIPHIDIPKFSKPNITIPKINLPKLNISTLKMPKLTLPKWDISAPNLPKFKTPNLELLDFRLPSFDFSSLLLPKLYFIYLAKHYFINFIALLLGLSLAFAMIDYFQHSQQLQFSSNYLIYYLFLMWQEALAQLYPITIVFAGIMTLVSLIKSSNMVVLYSFGYTKRQLFFPFFIVAMMIYGAFVGLHTTQFSYAKDKAQAMLQDGMRAYAVNDLFFIYEGDYVYAKTLDPFKKEMTNITLFRLLDNDLLYTVHAKKAKFDGEAWIAKDIIIKKLIYKNGALNRYSVEKRNELSTLSGYQPKMIESIYEGKALNIVDANQAWRLLRKQDLNTSKLRSSLNNKIIFPLFSIGLLLLIFFKVPFHARYMNLPLVLSLSLGATFVTWGVLFALNQMGNNGVLSPELAIPLPIALILLYAGFIYFRGKETI